jgi:hypothetical protein
MVEHAVKLVLATAFPSWYVLNLYGIVHFIVKLFGQTYWLLEDGLKTSLVEGTR